MGKLIYTRLCWWFTLRIKPVYWNYFGTRTLQLEFIIANEPRICPFLGWQMLIPPSQKIMGCGHVTDSQIMDFVHIWGSITRITPYIVDDIWFWSIYISSINGVFLELKWLKCINGLLFTGKKHIKFTGNPLKNDLRWGFSCRINPWNQFTRQLLVMISIWVNSLWTNNCQGKWLGKLNNIWVNIIYQNYIYIWVNYNNSLTWILRTK